MCIGVSPRRDDRHSAGADIEPTGQGTGGRGGVNQDLTEMMVMSMLMTLLKLSTRTTTVTATTVSTSLWISSAAVAWARCIDEPRGSSRRGRPAGCSRRGSAAGGGG